MARVTFKVSVDQIEDITLIARFARACEEAVIEFHWLEDGPGSISVDVPLWALKPCLIAFCASAINFPYDRGGKAYLVELEEFLAGNYGTIHVGLN